MENHENIGTVKDLVLYRVQTAKDDLSSARILLRQANIKGLIIEHIMQLFPCNKCDSRGKWGCF